MHHVGVSVISHSDVGTLTLGYTHVESTDTVLFPKTAEGRSLCPWGREEGEESRF